MKTTHVLEAEIVDDSGIVRSGHEFLNQFATARTGPTSTFRFSDEATLHNAVQYLERHEIRFQHFFTFDLDQEELTQYPAVYLGIHIISGLLVGSNVDDAAMDQFEIAVDYETECIISTPRVQDLLGNLVHGVVGRPIRSVAGASWLQLEVTRRLSEPIRVPSPAYVSHHGSAMGTFAVRSDGRDFITHRSIDELRLLGMALSDAVDTPSGRLSWAPRLLSTGAVASRLLNNHVNGVLQPLSPLLVEGMEPDAPAMGEIA